MTTAEFDELNRLMRAAYAEASTFDIHRRVELDGMTARLALKSSSVKFDLNTHCMIPAVRALVVRLIGIAWETLTHAHVKNALGHCASYVDAYYPLLSTAAFPPANEAQSIDCLQEISELLRAMDREEQRPSDA